MTPRFHASVLRRFALLGVLAFLLAACGGGSNKSSSASTTPATDNKQVKISGPETGAEADGFTEALAKFETQSGIKVTYSGSRDFETQIRVAAEGGDLPDIAVMPQPGLVRDIAAKIIPVPDRVLSAHKGDFNSSLFDLVTVNGKVLGIPNKADMKSLVWYSPKTFKAKGYTVPTTWDELMALQDKMRTGKLAPWCVGIESGDATGWPLTDWMEDLMLRMHGPQVYDDWVNHKIPFNDQKVIDVGKLIEKIWFTQGNVLNGRQSIASTGFAQAGLPVADGKCGMHRQANFYGAQFKTAKPNIKFGDDADVSVFYLPPMNTNPPRPTLTGGTFVVAFNNKPSTQKTLEYLASGEYASARIATKKSGFLSPNKNAVYDDPFDKQMADLLLKADPARFDGSDQMPSAVGSGSFWKEGTNWVLGTEDLKTFLTNVENSWPKK
jgi:alpha-glucoside transport system substrate-binding protein